MGHYDRSGPTINCSKEDNQEHDFGNKFISNSSKEVVIKDGEPKLKITWVEKRRCTQKVEYYGGKGVGRTEGRCKEEYTVEEGTSYIDLK
jgi:hypothetical protein